MPVVWALFQRTPAVPCGAVHGCPWRTTPPMAACTPLRSRHCSRPGQTRLASDVEVVGPCDDNTDAKDFTVVLKKATPRLAPTSRLREPRADKDVAVLLLRHDTTAGALARFCRDVRRGRAQVTCAAACEYALPSHGGSGGGAVCAAWARCTAAMVTRAGAGACVCRWRVAPACALTSSPHHPACASARPRSLPTPRSTDPRLQLRCCSLRLYRAPGSCRAPHARLPIALRRACAAPARAAPAVVARHAVTRRAGVPGCACARRVQVCAGHSRACAQSEPMYSPATHPTPTPPQPAPRRRCRLHTTATPTGHGGGDDGGSRCGDHGAGQLEGAHQ